MKSMLPLLAALACATLLFSGQAFAQQSAKPQNNDLSPAASRLVSRMMEFDKKHDGKLTRDEITDPRLLRLFDRADANKDGIVTREELVVVAKQIESEEGAGGGFGPGTGPGGFGGPPVFGPGGPPPGPFGFGGPPRPGQILPPMLRRQLKLTSEQIKQLDELQKEVDDKLARILTDEQRHQLQQMPPRGPGGRGPRGGGPPPPPPGESPNN